MCVFAKINELGFIETPYRKVENGKVDLSDNGLIYLTAEEEEEKVSEMFIRDRHTGVAQLVEHRSPKPGVGSSSLSSRANIIEMKKVIA